MIDRMKALAIGLALIIVGCVSATVGGPQVSPPAEAAGSFPALPADLRPGDKINGITLGAQVSCEDCAQISKEALKQLDADRPTHAAVADTYFFEDPLPSGAERSGTSRVIVLDLVDGTRIVYLVYCGVGGCHAM